MSKEIATVEVEGEKRVLRRSRRNRDTVKQGGSDTETETESDIIATWGIDSLLGNNKTVLEKGESESEESRYSFGNFSNTAQYHHKFGDETVTKTTSFEGVVEREKTRMNRDGDVRSKTTDSGLGRTPEPGMGDLLKFMAEEQRKK